MYLSVYIFLLISSFLQTFTKKFLPLFPFLVLIIMIAGFRNEVGKDYIAYKQIFENINTIFDYPLIEIGFKYIVLFFKKLHLNYLDIFFILGGISLTLYYRAIVMQTKYTYFAFFIFFNTYIVTAIFSGLRQGLVMGVFLYILNDMYKRSFLKVFFTSLIAFSIHITGILILFSYLIPSKVVIKRKYIVFALLGSFGFLFFDVSKFIFDYFPLYVQMKFIDYAEDFNDKINLMRVMQRFLLIVPFLIYYKKIVLYSDKLKYFFYLYLLGYFIYMGFSFNLAFATKINQFFRVLEIIMFPMLFELIKDRVSKIVLFILVTIWSSSILMLFINIPENFPYKVWDVF